MIKFNNFFISSKSQNTALIILFLLFSPSIWQGAGAFAQQNVGIGTTHPDPSAKLDIYAEHQGLLIPRVNLNSTTDSSFGVPHPAPSLLVYNTNSFMTGGGIGIYFWTGTIWQQAFG